MFNLNSKLHLSCPCYKKDRNSPTSPNLIYRLYAQVLGNVHLKSFLVFSNKTV